MLAIIAVGPTIEGAVLHAGQVIRHQIGSQLVALIHHRPQRLRAGLEGEAVGIAQARGIEAMGAGGAVDFPDRGAPAFHRHAVFGDVAVGADAGIELAAVGTGGEALGPVMVDRPARQFGKQRAGPVDAGLARLVGKAQHAVGVGDIEIAAHQHHAERRMQMVDEDVPFVGDAVAVGVTQQQDAVARLDARMGPLLDQVHDDLLGTADRLARAVRFRHQHIAIGQGVDRAGIFQSPGQGGDTQSCRHFRHGVTPADILHHMHGRYQILVRRGQVRMRPDLLCGIVRIGAAAAKGDQRRGRQKMPPRHGRSPATATPWRWTMAQPFQPVTSRTSTVSADRIRPVGTTEV